jgi:hypothetical protein
MTKNEAIEAMREGKKVTHRYFTDGEYLYMENGMLFSEEGYHHRWFDFWNERKEHVWDIDWEILG